MAWTQSDLDLLDNAIKGGELVVQYQDRRVTYRTLDEMLRLRAIMESEINAPASDTERVAKQVRMSTTKGF